MKHLLAAVLLLVAISSFAEGDITASVTLRNSSVIKGTIAHDTALD